MDTQTNKRTQFILTAKEISVTALEDNLWKLKSNIYLTNFRTY